MFNIDQPTSFTQLDPRIFYIVERTSSIPQDKTELYSLLKDHKTIYPGFVLRKIFNDIKNYSKITHYCTISNIHKDKISDINYIVKTIFNDTTISSTQKKAICNFVLGHLEKVQNKESRVALFDSQFEAIEYASRVKSQVFPYHETDYNHKIDIDNPSTVHPLLDNKPETSYIVSKKASSQLCNGFYPIKMALHALERLQMYNLHKEIQDSGCVVHSYRTDAIYFYSPDELEEVSLESTFDNIGKTTLKKLKQDDKIPVTKIRDRNEKISITPFVPVKIDYVAIQSEEYWKSDPQKYLSEVITLLDSWNGNRIMISGSEFGVGKTSLAKSYLKHHETLGKKIVVAAQANKRVGELRSDFDQAQTIHNLLSIRMDESNEEVVVADSKKSNKLSDVDFLFIDEIFMLPTKTLNRLNRLICQNPSITVIATGDVEQQRVSDINIQNQNSYYSNCIDTMFNKGVLLQINKRFQDPQDRVDIKKIKASLKSGNREEFLKYVNTFNSLDQLYDIVCPAGVFNGKIICYFRDCRTSINVQVHDRIINSLAKKYTPVGVFKLFKGCKLTVCSRLKLKPRVLQRNETVEVVSIDDQYVTMEVYDDNTIQLDPDQFKIPLWYFENFDNFQYVYCKENNSRV